MIAAAAVKRMYWIGVVEDSFDDRELTHGEFLMTLHEVERWHRNECMRIDALYCAFYGVR
jgi:hypothetical protein